jgi:DNA topoisomerase-1
MARANDANETLTPLDVARDPEASARLAGLRYVSDAAPGYRRVRRGSGFSYVDQDGNTVRDEALRKRFKALVIPPAWTDVWICRSPRGHLQVTGRDEKGRKQYIYHPKWSAIRNEAKFWRIIPFGEALPTVRERIEQDLRHRSLTRDKVLATVASLLDATHIRVGNDAYARDNNSFGLTTMRDRHVQFDASKCVFSFTGKSGKEHCVELDDPRLVRIIRECKEVPGYELFQYYDVDGGRRSVNSQDVNVYLKDTTGQDFTAKDFRTWAGSVRAAVALNDFGPVEGEKRAQKNIGRMVKDVAEELGNTVAVCRAYYIHPAIMDAYVEGELLERWPDYLARESAERLHPEENALLHFLRDHLSQTADV